MGGGEVGGNHHFLSFTATLAPSPPRPHTHTHTFSISSDLHYDERSHLCPLVKYTDDKRRGENVRTAGRRRARFLFDDTFSLKYHRFLF